jgi:hypothetical protein
LPIALRDALALLRLATWRTRRRRATEVGALRLLLLRLRRHLLRCPRRLRRLDLLRLWRDLLRWPLLLLRLNLLWLRCCALATFLAAWPLATIPRLLLALRRRPVSLTTRLSPLATSLATAIIPSLLRLIGRALLALFALATILVFLISVLRALSLRSRSGRPTRKPDPAGPCQRNRHRQRQYFRSLGTSSHGLFAL